MYYSKNIFIGTLRSSNAVVYLLERDRIKWTKLKQIRRLYQVKMVIEYVHRLQQESQEIDI